MKPIEDYAEIPPLLAGYFRRGVRTNHFLSAADHQADIAAKNLYCHTWPGGLLLIRQREGYRRLYFFITDPKSLPTLDFGGIAVTEIPSRPRDGEDGELFQFWRRIGFERTLERLRLQCSGEAVEAAARIPAPPLPIRRATAADSAALGRLYAECFDPYFGCIPNQEERNRALAGGQIFCAEGETGGLCGLIGTSPPPYNEIRHLAVAGDRRGKGVASALVRHYLMAARPKKGLVWTGARNEAAIRLYENCGYSGDGWKSTVFMRKEESR